MYFLFIDLSEIKEGLEPPVHVLSELQAASMERGRPYPRDPRCFFSISVLSLRKLDICSRL